MGFTVQSVLRRVPIAIAPTLGGLAIAAYGARSGVRLGLAISVVLALATLAVASRVQIPVVADEAPTDVRAVWRSLPAPLRRLLLSDILIRTCEGMVDVFVVLYAIDVVGISAPQFGALVAVQMVTSILSYVPAARLADRTGRKPFVIGTFVAFSLFPLTVVLSTSFAWLVAAFVVGGLRELGEPARKALIVDLSRPSLRARSIGLYYLVRSVSIAPAAFVGGLLWKIAPVLPFQVAAGIGLVGTAAFALTVDERRAG
jgi:MFS family permease